jgi:hypothetical protein
MTAFDPERTSGKGDGDVHARKQVMAGATLPLRVNIKLLMMGKWARNRARALSQSGRLPKLPLPQ